MALTSTNSFTETNAPLRAGTRDVFLFTGTFFSGFSRILAVPSKTAALLVRNCFTLFRSCNCQDSFDPPSDGFSLRDERATALHFTAHFLTFDAQGAAESS